MNNRDHARAVDLPTALSMVAPVSGRVVALADVPDQVFAQEVVGPGLAIEPLRGALPGTLRGARPEGAAPVESLPDGAVLAPVAGTVAALFPHAFAIETADGRTVLVHLGIDTVSLHGEGFDVLVAVGEQVGVGQHLLTWDPDSVSARGLATVCPVVAMQADPAGLTALVSAGQLIARGDPLLRWT